MIFREKEVIVRAKKDDEFMGKILQSEDAEKFIKYVIKTYTKNPAFFMQTNKVEWEDLYQACLIGLYNGLKNLDIRKNSKEWVRYLYLYIQGEIKNFSRSNNSNSLVISQKIRLLYPKYILFYHEFREGNGKDPTVDDTINEFSITRDEAFDLIYGMQQVISYHTEQGDIDRSLFNGSGENVEKEVINKLLIQQYFRLLNNKEKKVLFMHYYLGFNKTEIAKEIGCGNTMVQKHITNAFKKIKKFDLQRAV